MDSPVSTVALNARVAVTRPPSCASITGSQQQVQNIPHENAEISMVLPTRTASVMTKSRFSFLELPVELRLQIYQNLLVCSESINIPSHSDLPSKKDIPSYPSVAIIQTCRLINEEATPILYSKNRFVIMLPLSRGLSTNSREPSTPIHTEPFFHPSNFRWSTLTQMTSLAFTSGNDIDPPDPDLPLSSLIPRAAFNCSGQELISRVSPGSIIYSPQGPDKYMALSMANWISLRVMTAELNAFQKELEDMMGSGLG